MKHLKATHYFANISFFTTFIIAAMLILSKPYIDTINTLTIILITLISLEFLLLLLGFMICAFSKQKGTILQHARTKIVIIFIAYIIMLFTFLFLIFF